MYPPLADEHERIINKQDLEMPVISLFVNVIGCLFRAVELISDILCRACSIDHRKAGVVEGKSTPGGQCWLNLVHYLQTILHMYFIATCTATCYKVVRVSTCTAAQHPWANHECKCIRNFACKRSGISRQRRYTSCEGARPPRSYVWIFRCLVRSLPQLALARRGFTK